MFSLYILMTIFVACQGNYLCMLGKYMKCGQKVTSTIEASSKSTSYCVSATEKYQCWVEESKKCEVEDTKVVRNLLADYNEVCLDEWDNAYRDRQECVHDLFETAQVMGAGPCDYVLQMEGTAAPKNFDSFCRSFDMTFDCLRANVLSLCGRDSDYVFCKLLGSRQKLLDAACRELGHVNNVTLQDSWCVVNSAMEMSAVNMFLYVFLGLLIAKLLKM